MTDEAQPAVGMTVHAADGIEPGNVRGFDDNDFFVATHERLVGMSVEHERAGHEFGEAESMWQCSSCGEMGDLGEPPGACLNYGAEREQLYYWTEG